ncbi:hypothetical protein SU69_09000 [Thermosipho melanesiensis]|uniref:Metallophosphoesterase n=2 Tax=Thermosipho melanesiensis TaxID=46541 RepID=A6LNW6_THEM4|nr:metallophosphoesterase family protein [Thermosipho melanesiensis]ABR31617.1 metallophosphoesterase [Thermosipho melanesiensis BI429]APT74646.1 metallophosphoesterase [Thermosipho melanesiensis]OOC35145.1 hypothetical protein SU69_09000 [Thermosipho melanesiensis]OOC35355.1 hypothetical protein SU70_09010 [Thermosipho melanesiensis]OOC36606.1 hypothetical protein SU68_09070 [Thermosipho melanesiensis]
MKGRIIFIIVLIPILSLSNGLYFLYEDGTNCTMYCDKDFYPRTNNTIAVYGDSRWNDKIHGKIVQLIENNRPSIVIHLGDMVNRGDNLREWKKFFEITSSLRKNSYFQLVKGNHENPDIYFKKFFGYYNYYADYKGVRLIFLDLNGSVDFLKKYGNKNSIVFIHYPIYTVGPHYKDNLNLSRLNDVIKQKGIKLVISAHDHNYQRFVVGRITYIVSGGGGAFLYDKVIYNEHLVSFYKKHHFLLLKLIGNSVEIKVIDLENKVLEEFSVEF